VSALGSRVGVFWPFLRRPHLDPKAAMARMESLETRDYRFRPLLVRMPQFIAAGKIYLVTFSLNRLLDAY
jgi:hypothetical protein